MYGSELMSCASDCCILLCFWARSWEWNYLWTLSRCVHFLWLLNILGWFIRPFSGGLPKASSMTKGVSQVILIVISCVHIWFTVFILLCTRMQACPAVGRGHTEINYCQLIVLTFRSVTSSVSLNPQTCCGSPSSVLSYHQKFSGASPRCPVVATGCVVNSAGDLFESQ